MRGKVGSPPSKHLPVRDVARLKIKNGEGVKVAPFPSLALRDKASIEAGEGAPVISF